MLKSNQSKNYSNVSLPAKMEKIYGMHRLVGLQLFLSGTPTFSSGTPTFCQMGVLNSCFQNPSESSDRNQHPMLGSKLIEMYNILYTLKTFCPT